MRQKQVSGQKVPLLIKLNVDTALQLTMAYQARHLNSDEMLTIGSDGQMVHKNKRQLKEEFSTTAKDKPITPCAKPVIDNEASTESDIARFTNL